MEVFERKVINTEYYARFKDFKDAVLGFLENLTDHKEELKRFIGLKLHLFNPFPFKKRESHFELSIKGH